MSHILNYGITWRPCWMHRLPLEIVTMKNVDVRVHEGVETIYYDIDGDIGLRYRTFQEEGYPPFVWAPDGFELPGEGETVEVRTHEMWGHYIVIFDWDWFLGLDLSHDAMNLTCEICRQMRKKQGLSLPEDRNGGEKDG